MITPLYEEGIPSEQANLISRLTGQKLCRLIRYSWLPENEAIKEYKLEKNDVFSLTSGSLLMYFDTGLVVGCGSQPSRNSVTLWVEKNEQGELIEELSENDEELFPLDASQQSFWCNFLGKKINSFQVIFEKPRHAKYTDLPNEVGLVVIFEDSSEFILSHGLHDNSDDFSVIGKEQITKEIIDRLYMQRFSM